MERGAHGGASSSEMEPGRRAERGEERSGEGRARKQRPWAEGLLGGGGTRERWPIAGSCGCTVVSEEGLSCGARERAEVAGARSLGGKPEGVA